LLNLSFNKPRGGAEQRFRERVPGAGPVTVAGSGAWLDHSGAGNVTDTGNVADPRDVASKG